MSSGARVARTGSGVSAATCSGPCFERPDSIDIVAVDDVNDPEMLAYLLEFDTVRGHLPERVELVGNRLRVGDSTVHLSGEREPLRRFVISNVTVVARRVLADRSEFVLDATSAEAWEAINRRRARDLPGLRRLMERPSPFDPE